MKRFGFIYNPAARNNHSGSSLQKLTRQLDQLPGSELLYSESKEHITDLVSQLSDRFDVIVACGGDGTVREVATGNDLCNNFFFLNTLGFGFDGYTNLFALDFRHWPSFFRYLVAALKANFYQNPFSVSIDIGQTVRETEALMITLANGRVEGGSFWIAPKASITDGKLDIVSIDPVKRWVIPLLLPLFLVKKGVWIPQVHTEEVSSVKLKFSSTVALHADGEVIKTNESEFRISLISSRLTVICGG